MEQQAGPPGGIHPRALHLRRARRADNLAVEARFKPVLDRYRDKLRAWCESIDDPFARHLPRDA